MFEFMDIFFYQWSIQNDVPNAFRIACFWSKITFLDISTFFTVALSIPTMLVVAAKDL